MRYEQDILTNTENISCIKHTDAFDYHFFNTLIGFLHQENHERCRGDPLWDHICCKIGWINHQNLEESTVYR